MNIFGQLKKAVIENTNDDLAQTIKGLFWFNTTENKVKFYDGSAIRTIATTDSTTFPQINIDEQAAVVTPEAGKAVIYVKGDDKLAYLKDDTGADKLVGSEQAIIDFTEQAVVPASPSIGHLKVYSRADGELYKVGNDGVENPVVPVMVDGVQVGLNDVPAMVANITLTNTSKYIQRLNPQVNGLKVTLPSALTMLKGKLFTIINSSREEHLKIVDNDGVLLIRLAQQQSARLTCIDNTTAAGEWEIENTSKDQKPFPLCYASPKLSFVTAANMSDLYFLETNDNIGTISVWTDSANNVVYRYINCTGTNPTLGSSYSIASHKFHAACVNTANSGISSIYTDTDGNGLTFESIEYATVGGAAMTLKYNGTIEANTQHITGLNISHFSDTKALIVYTNTTSGFTVFRVLTRVTATNWTWSVPVNIVSCDFTASASIAKAISGLSVVSFEVFSIGVGNKREIGSALIDTIGLTASSFPDSSTGDLVVCECGFYKSGTGLTEKYITLNKIPSVLNSSFYIDNANLPFSSNSWTLDSEKTTALEKVRAFHSLSSDDANLFVECLFDYVDINNIHRPTTQQISLRSPAIAGNPKFAINTVTKDIAVVAMADKVNELSFQKINLAFK